MIEPMLYYGNYAFQGVFYILVLPDADHLPSCVRERYIREAIPFDVPP